MADDTTAATPAEQPQPEIKILNQYVRDLSFENVAAQQDFEPDTQPNIQVGINVDANPQGDDKYLASLKVTAKAVVEEQTIFMVDLDYVGLFEMKNIPEEQLHPVMLIECPRLIFPFVRRIVADVSRDGGYPPLMLDPIDFVALYRSQLEKFQSEQAAGGGAGAKASAPTQSSGGSKVRKNPNIPT